MKPKWLSAALVALFLCPAGAAEIALIPTRDLAFGAFVAGTGTVTMTAAGARSTSGGVIALSSESGSAAQFSVTGDEAATYAISLPADGTVFLVNGGSTMPVNAFTSSPLAGGTFFGTQVISVGATLDVAEGQATGSYSGSFTVIVDYN